MQAQARLAPAARWLNHAMVSGRAMAVPVIMLIRDDRADARDRGPNRRRAPARTARRHRSPTAPSPSSIALMTWSRRIRMRSASIAAARWRLPMCQASSARCTRIARRECRSSSSSAAMISTWRPSSSTSTSPARAPAARENRPAAGRHAAASISLAARDGARHAPGRRRRRAPRRPVRADNRGGTQNMNSGGIAVISTDASLLIACLASGDRCRTGAVIPDDCLIDQREYHDKRAWNQRLRRSARQRSHSTTNSGVRIRYSIAEALAMRSDP